MEEEKENMDATGCEVYGNTIEEKTRFNCRWCQVQLPWKCHEGRLFVSLGVDAVAVIIK